MCCILYTFKLHSMQTPTAEPPPETQLPLRCHLCFLVSGLRERPDVRCPRWISHDFLCEVPWSHLPAFRYRWSVCSPTSWWEVGSLWAHAEEVSMRRTAWNWSMIIWPDFLPGLPYVWTKKKRRPWCHGGRFIHFLLMFPYFYSNATMFPWSEEWCYLSFIIMVPSFISFCTQSILLPR